VPAPAAADLLAGPSPEAAGELAAIAHSSVTLVTFVLDERDVTVDPALSGVLVAAGEGRLMTAVSFGSSKWPHWGDGGHVVLRASAGRTGDERQAAMSDRELVDALRADLRDVVGVTAEPLATRVSRYPEGFAQYEVGHAARVGRIEAALARDLPHVRVAGAAYRGLGIPACIRQGRLAVRDLLSG
jgi:oxygen-dependent protoporphyrinogen oxidase